MNSIKNMLQFINDNWATIVTIAVLAYGIYIKAKKAIADWKAKSEAEKEAAIKDAEAKAIAAARAALENYILALVAKAEVEWNDKGSKLGEIKRAEVIAQIYAKYPVLENVADQAELLSYIDNLINKALVTVRETIRKDME